MYEIEGVLAAILIILCCADIFSIVCVLLGTTPPELVK